MKAAVGNPEVLSLALLSCALTLLPVFVPIGGGLLSALAPFPLIVLAVKYPWRYAMGLLALEGGLMLLGSHWQSLLFLGQCSLMVLAIAWAIRRGWSISQTLVGSLALMFGVGALFLAVRSTFVPSPTQSLVTRYVDNIVYMSQEYVRAVEQLQEDEDEQLTALMEALPQLVFTVLPALVVIGHLVTNLCNYILVRRYCQRSQPPLTLDPDDLTCWRASDYLVWIFLASGTALLVPIDLVSAIGLNVLLVTLAIYLLQGLAIVLFWGRRLPLPLGVQCLMIVVVFLIAGPLCVIVCTAAGLFDLWVDFRRQRHHPLLPQKAAGHGRYDQHTPCQQRRPRRREAMKVILMRDVEHVGDVGDVVDVADGYGRNFLIPRGLAVAATARNKRQLEHEQRLREHRILRVRKDAQTLAEQLQGVPCHFVRKAGEEGKLFGSVTSMDIADALKEAGFEVDRRYIQLDQPIKSVGDFTVPVRLPAETSALLKVTVTAE